MRHSRLLGRFAPHSLPVNYFSFSLFLWNSPFLIVFKFSQIFLLKLTNFLINKSRHFFEQHCTFLTVRKPSLGSCELALQNLGHDRFSRFDIYWPQTNKQTNKQTKSEEKTMFYVPVYIISIVNNGTL